MRLPFALASLDWIVPRDVQGARISLELEDQRGWTCPAGSGYCVATAIPLPTHLPSSPTHGAHDMRMPVMALESDTALARWLTRLSLVLAGQSALRDDSLCIANDTLWWVHRFDSEEPVAQVEAKLRRQLLACAMAAASPADTRRTAPPDSGILSSVDAERRRSFRTALRRG